MRDKQLLRVITSLSSLYNKGCSVGSISTELVPSPEDLDFLDPVVIIEYIRPYEYDEKLTEHKVKVYDDGSASDS